MFGLDKILGMFSADMAIDLGTANTLVYVKGRGIILSEPSVVAYHVKDGVKKVLAVGEDAKLMLGRTPGSIEAIRPMREGVIADFDTAEAMIKHFIRKVHRRSTFSKPKIIVCVPHGATPVEKRAIRQSVLSAGARKAGLISEPIAAAIGAGMPITDPTGSMVVDIGGGTTDVAVISLGGVVVAESLRIAGNEFDEAIVRFVRHKESMLIGDRTAEEIKLRVGAASVKSPGEVGSFEVRGRDITSGLPKTATVTTDDVVEALRDPLEKIAAAVQRVLETAPPELVSDVIDKGIIMTGGGALLRNFDDLLQGTTGIPVAVAENAADCVALGTGKALTMADRLEDALVSDRFLRR